MDKSNNTIDKKVDIHTMDAVLLERCTPWITAVDETTSTAALEEYIEATLGLIALDGSNPLYRHDITEQAIATIKTLVNHYGMDRSLDQNQEIRTYMVYQFQTRMIEKMLDSQYGNSLKNENDDLAKKREGLRSSFQKVLTVDPSLMTPRITSNETANEQSDNKWEKLKDVEAMIKIDCPIKQDGRNISQKLIKKVLQLEKRLVIGRTESGGEMTLDIYPSKLSRRSAQFVKELLQPIEKMLGELGYVKTETLKNDFPRCLISHWKLTNEGNRTANTTISE